jgi:hypothetical protein
MATQEAKTEAGAEHTPERQPHESQREYRERQRSSKHVVWLMTRGPHQAPAKSPLDTSRFFLGQHTNPERKKLRAVFIKANGVRQWKRMQQSTRRLVVQWSAP